MRQILVAVVVALALTTFVAAENTTLVTRCTPEIFVDPTPLSGTNLTSTKSSEENEWIIFDVRLKNTTAFAFKADMSTRIRLNVNDTLRLTSSPSTRNSFSSAFLGSIRKNRTRITLLDGNTIVRFNMSSLPLKDFSVTTDETVAFDFKIQEAFVFSESVCKERNEDDVLVSGISTNAVSTAKLKITAPTQDSGMRWAIDIAGGAAGVGAVAAALATNCGAGGLIDLQLLAVFNTIDCASGSSRELSDTLLIFTTPFLVHGAEMALLGNLAIVAGFALIHLAVYKGYFFSQLENTTDAAAQALLFFPSKTLVVCMCCLSGMCYAAMFLVTEYDDDSVQPAMSNGYDIWIGDASPVLRIVIAVPGFLMAVGLVAAFIAIVRIYVTAPLTHQPGVNAASPPQSPVHQEPLLPPPAIPPTSRPRARFFNYVTDTENVVTRFLYSPAGLWTSSNLTRRFGIVYGGHSPDNPYWSAIELINIMVTIMLSMAPLGTDDVTCQMKYAALAAPFTMISLVTLFFRPHRMPLLNLVNGVGCACMGAYLTAEALLATEVNHRGSQEMKGGAVFAVVAVSMLKSTLTVVFTAVEAFWWEPEAIKRLGQEERIKKLREIVIASGEQSVERPQQPLLSPPDQTGAAGNDLLRNSNGIAPYRPHNGLTPEPGSGGAQDPTLTREMKEFLDGLFTPGGARNNDVESPRGQGGLRQPDFGDKTLDKWERDRGRAQYHADRRLEERRRQGQWPPPEKKKPRQDSHREHHRSHHHSPERRHSSRSRDRGGDSRRYDSKHPLPTNRHPSSPMRRHQSSTGRSGMRGTSAEAPKKGSFKKDDDRYYRSYH